MSAVFIHGFLGLPQDWSPLFEGRRIDLWKEVSPLKFSNLSDAGKKLSEIIPGEKLTLVGYSLGGRIALHWPQDQWHRIAKMILISVHGGLSLSSEKKARQQQDEKWAERFLNDSWNEVIRDWNTQEVFLADAVRPQRKEMDYDRAALSAALTNWSLGGQEEQFFRLSSAPFSISYCHGLYDAKFSKYAEQLQKNGSALSFRSFEAGHSFHLSHTQELAEMISAARLT